MSLMPPLVDPAPAPAPRRLAFDGVVFLSPFPWRGCWQTPHYLAQALAELGSPPGLLITPRPRVQPGAWRALEPPPAAHQPNRLTLWTLPNWDHRTLRRWSVEWAARQVNAAARRHGFRQPLLWVFYAKGCSRLVRRLGWPYVYHCLDHFEFGDPAEQRELAHGAVAVFAASPLLQREFAAGGIGAHWLPNGVAMPWFSAPSPPPPRPARTRHRIGFAGTVNRHLDYALLLAIARQLPACDLVLLGPAFTAGMSRPQSRLWRDLRRQGNVHRIGFRPAWRLAGYIREWDVAVIPNLTNRWSQCANPLKLWQYLALGKPVVAMSTPSLAPHSDVCYLAGSTEEFVAQIQTALAESPSATGRLGGALAQRRIARAGAFAWPSILAQALACLQPTGGPTRLPPGPGPAAHQATRDAAVFVPTASRATDPLGSPDAPAPPRS